MLAATEAGKMSGVNGVNKKKQSKSRNGCVTCKAKRLKCDETKPSCSQCARRNVPCGGYHKDFKWRAFAEVDYTGRTPAGKSRKAVTTTALQERNSAVPRGEAYHNAALTVDQSAFQSYVPSHGATMKQHRTGNPGRPLSPSYQYRATFSKTRAYEPDPPDRGLFRDNDNNADDTRSMRSFSSGQSPSLADLLLPGTDLNVPNPEYQDFRSRFPDAMFKPSISDAVLGSPRHEDEDVDVEDIVPASRQPNPDHAAWVMCLPTPPQSNSASVASGQLLVNSGIDPSTWMIKEPLFNISSPELLTLRFDRQTCGVLSVKDGPTENPWRTLIWPLARDNTALYHAIASMTSFHYAKDVPKLRLQGIEHMRTSIKALAEGLRGSMKLETAIATTIALAFSESWDQHISTGINHIKGARTLVRQALQKHQQNPLQGEELLRMRFLANTWIYMDVLARLTSVDGDESNDFEIVFSEFADPFGADTDMDPLMGCAATLFPIIGRVMNLVRKVRRLPSNSPTMISQAMDLKASLENWMPPSYFERPEDPSTEIEHGIQTAEAYRWASLLYLHQAIPEIPSMSSAELARKVMVYLATVPLSSRTVIVQMYPLIAAGSEASDEEDRQWVLERWRCMSLRMKLGIIDRCAEVVKEVWSRRDEHRRGRLSRVNSTSVRQGSTSAVPSLSRESSLADGGTPHTFDWNADLSGSMSYQSPVGRVLSRENSAAESIRKAPVDAVEYKDDDADYTVRSELHWVTVMKEWKWEVLLG